MKKFFSSIFAHYLRWFGVYNALFTLFLCSVVGDGTAIICLVIFQVIETYFIWYKKIYKHSDDKYYLFSKVEQNNLLAIYGGIGTGKSTLGHYILNHYCKDDNLKYYNYKKEGFKAFTHDYLYLKKALPKGAGVYIDEASRMAMSSKTAYDKKNDNKRLNILSYNKFFRQWYGDQAICVYIDQCEESLDTHMRRIIFYVIQCLGLKKRAMPLFLGGMYALFNSMFKWTRYNIFSLVDIEFIDFNKLGSYADHYEINYNAKDLKHFVEPAFILFTNNDTYAFEDCNPAKYDETEDYYWGTDEQYDNLIMDKNFDLSSFNENFKT